MSSGLDALRIAIIATGVSPGSEVLVPANTFIATFEAITQAGASRYLLTPICRTTTWTSTPPLPR